MNTNCKNCKYNKRIDECFDCHNFEKFTPCTNRQWLENMSDEELAKIILQHDEVCCQSCIHEKELCDDSIQERCLDGIKQWLQAEYKE